MLEELRLLMPDMRSDYLAENCLSLLCKNFTPCCCNCFHFIQFDLTNNGYVDMVLFRIDLGLLGACSVVLAAYHT